jgi:hypothetical protein
MSFETDFDVSAKRLLALPTVLTIASTSMLLGLTERGTGTPSTLLRFSLPLSARPPATPAAAAPTATAGPVALPATCFAVPAACLAVPTAWPTRLLAAGAELCLELALRCELELGLDVERAFDAVAARVDLAVARLPELDEVDLRWVLLEPVLALAARDLLALPRADVVDFDFAAALGLDVDFDFVVALGFEAGFDFVAALGFEAGFDFAAALDFAAGFAEPLLVLGAEPLDDRLPARLRVLPCADLSFAAIISPSVGTSGAIYPQLRPFKPAGSRSA